MLLSNYEIYKFINYKNLSLRSLLNDVFVASLQIVISIQIAISICLTCQLPLSMPFYSLMFIAPLIALFSRQFINNPGPTASMIILFLPVSSYYGPFGITIITFLSGIFIVFFSFIKAERFIRIVPLSIFYGFTFGSGITIMISQIHGVVGNNLLDTSYYIVYSVINNLDLLTNVHFVDLLLGISSLISLFLFNKVKYKKIPTLIYGIISGYLLSFILNFLFHSSSVTTIQDIFANNVTIPYNLTVTNTYGYSLKKIIAIDYTFFLKYSFSLALMCTAISINNSETAKNNHNINYYSKLDLLSLGIGNILSSIIGGIALTSSLDRTKINIKFNIKTFLSILLQGILIYFLIRFFPNLILSTPISVASAIVLYSGATMIDFKKITLVMKSDFLLDKSMFILSFFLTVFFGIVIGIIITSLCFFATLAYKISCVSGGKWIFNLKEINSERHLKPGILFYKFFGTLLSGSIENSLYLLDRLLLGYPKLKAIIIDFRELHTFDLSFVIKLENTLNKLSKKSLGIILLTQENSVLENYLIKNSSVVKSYYFKHTVNEALNFTENL